MPFPQRNKKLVAARTQNAGSFVPLQFPLSPMMARQSHVPFTWIVQAIVEGAVNIVGCLAGKPGFQGLLVDVGAVRNLFPPNRKGLHADAARLLKVDKSTIAALIKLST
jgi:hypothetical protein